MNSLVKPFNPTGATLTHLRRLATRPPTHQLPKYMRSYGQTPSRQSIQNASKPKGFSRSSTRRCALSEWTFDPRRIYSTNTKPDISTQTSSSLSVSQRFRKLSREYGWTAMGVYFALSALDFPFCFLAVRWLGPDRVGRAEKAVVGRIKEHIPQSIKDGLHQAKAKIKELRGGEPSTSAAGDSTTFSVAEMVDDYDHGVADAEIRSQGANASIWTQLALAYAIHKSFIFIRLPITVAILPKVVKTLRGWGWQIGKRKPKNIQV